MTIDINDLRRALESNATVTVQSHDLKPLLEELVTLRSKSSEIVSENNQLKSKIEEYNFAIQRGIEQMRENMREVFVKMHEAHELLREVRPHSIPTGIASKIDRLLKRDGLLEDEE